MNKCSFQASLNFLIKINLNFDTHFARYKRINKYTLHSGQKAKITRRN